MSNLRLKAIMVICLAMMMVAELGFAAANANKVVSITLPTVSKISLDVDLSVTIADLDMENAYTNGYHEFSYTGTLNVFQNRPWRVSVTPSSFAGGDTNLILTDFSIKVNSVEDAGAANLASSFTSFVDTSTAINLAEESAGITINKDIVIKYRMDNVDETIEPGTVTINVTYTIANYS